MAESAFAPFRPARRCQLRDFPINRILYGHWREEEVVVVRVEPSAWEIHCHGGAAASARILHDLNQALPEWNSELHSVTKDFSLSDVTSRNRAHDITATEVLETDEELRFQVDRVITQTLMKCRTRKSATLVLAQADGRLVTLIRHLKSDDAEIRSPARECVDRWRTVAAHLCDPFRVAIVGAPNAGKSSLVNALSGRERMIVSESAGTTRDVVETMIVIDGWMFQLVDTAGIRDQAECDLERAGIEQGLRTLTDCDLVCIVQDSAMEAECEFSAVLMSALQSLKVPICVVENKSDLLTSRGNQTATPHPESVGDVGAENADFLRWASGRQLTRCRVSAVTGEGLDVLRQWIRDASVPEEPSILTTLPLPDLI